MDEIVQFDFPTDSPKIIKVIGVGGGGGNAVNHMYREGIHDVTFVLCNTDNQALAESPVPVKLQLGRSITQGLGAGNRPERARDAAEESIEDIKAQLNDGTKMVFITAGMGGGTGTGAAPVIARIAKEMDILTVGIVTIPFIFEGEKKIIQALDGVERIAQHVDALLVINNERLREIYADLTFMNAFGKADDTLSIAAKSIAEIITMRGTVNLDFADVKTILKDGGVAIMSTGFGEGENRVTKAIDDALHSPLLNNNDIFNAKKVMLNVSFCPSSELMMEEMNEIHEFMSKFREGVEVIWGVAIDNSLDTKVKITVLATGFGVEDVPGMDSLHAARSQEEEERQLQLEEEKEKNKERIRKAYGESASNIGSKSLRKRRHIYLFNTEDLDNDDIIAMVEDSPTYMRDKTTLTKIRTKAALEEEVTTEEATEARATMLRKRPSMWLPTRPTGLACRLLPTLYSCGATSSISISTTGMAMFSSPIALTSSSDMMASSSRSRLTTLRTVRSDCPPMPTYTLAIEFFNSPSSLLMIEVRLCAVLSRLKITPLRINVEESSWAYANTCMLPSLFFLPATPVIFDEPSSIAAINSVVAIYIYLRFYDLQFTIEKRLFTLRLSTVSY